MAQDREPRAQASRVPNAGRRPPGFDRRAAEPSLPVDFDRRDVPPALWAELRSLPKDLAEAVASHLVMAGRLLENDPERAHSHAEAARRRAARLPIVREAAAETAYAAEHYDTALAEFRALRRMAGADDFLPAMADCERALGRPEAALKLAQESTQHRLDLAMRVEMTIVEAGARQDLGQHAEARRVLAAAVARTRTVPPAAGAAVGRLHYAYADALLSAGDRAGAREHFAAAAGTDSEVAVDARERLDALDGLVIDFDDSDPDDNPDPDPDPDPDPS